MEASMHPSAEGGYGSGSCSELDQILSAKGAWFFDGPNSPCAPGEEHQETFGLSFVSVFCCVQKGSGVTGLLGTTMMPIILTLIGVKPLVSYWICYLYV